MENQLSGTQWHWDSNRGDHFYRDDANGRWVYSNGMVVYYPQTQTSPYGSQSTTQYGQDSMRHSRVESLDSGIGLSGNTDALLSELNELTIQADPEPGSSRQPNSPRKKKALNSKFIVRKDRFFQVGKVFKVLFSEPSGPDNKSEDVSYNTYDEAVSNKVRWFVVISRNEDYSSSCLAIHTYGKRGVAKPDLVKAHHAIVYSGNTAPPPKPDEYPEEGEDGMLRPIKVEMRSSKDRIDRMSRINFKSISTIQHNWKVYDVGVVDAGFMTLLSNQWRKVWFDLGDKKNNNQARDGKKRMKACIEEDELNAVPEGEEDAYDDEDEDDNEETFPSTSVIAYATATHDYSEHSEGHLGFTKGDRIEVTAFLDENWGKGWCTRTNQHGLYPRSYVQHY